MREDIERQQGKVDSIKMALANTPSSYEVLRGLFPDYFAPEDPFAEARTEDGGYDPDLVDEDALDWSAPESEDVDAEISRWIAQREASFSADEMDWDD